MGIILHLFVAAIGMFLYNKRQKGWFVVILYMVMTSFFGYLPVGNVGKDISVLMIACTLILTPKCDYLNCDSIKKWIIILLSYYGIRCLCSILLGEEEAVRALKLVRLEYGLIAYFALKRIPLNELKKALNILLYFTVPLCIIQIIHVLSGQADYTSSIAGRDYMSIRMGLIPNTAIPFFAYLFLKQRRSTKDWFFLAIIASSVVLGNVRGLFLSLIITTIVFIIRQGNFKYLFWGVLIIPIMWSKFNDNSQKEDTMTELSATLANLRGSGISDADVPEGNLEFRIILVMERCAYLSEDISRLLFGIGAIEERSPNNKLSFVIGSGNLDENGIYYRQQIETTDVAFITNTLRYGFIYLIIFVSFIVAIYKTGFRYKSIYSDIAIFSITVYLIAVPTNNYLSSMGYLFPLLLSIVTGVKDCNCNNINEVWGN